MFKRRLLTICCIAAALAASAADTSTAIFDRAFRTLKVAVKDGFFDPPVIRLGTDDRIVVSFDELGDDWSELQYRLLHCNADWQPSRLSEPEYLGSFNIADIDDYAFSSNTFIHYVNYRVEIPSEDMQPLVSGNYLMQVFRHDDPEETLLQARFSIVEPLTIVTGQASGRTDRGVNTEYQQIGFRVKGGDFDFGNPFQDVVAVVTRNNDPSSSRRIEHPFRLEGKDILYEHIPDLIFKASDEYRRFETVRIPGPDMRIDSMRYVGPGYHAWVMTDRPRRGRDYSYDETQHGRFLVREYNSTDSDLGADYVVVNLTLDAPEIYDGDIYVDGEFTNGGFSEMNRMTFDHDRRLYTLSIPLKQGSYNYRYVVLPNSLYNGPADLPPDPSPIEGDKYETSNEYRVDIFHRPPGSRADRLIGSTVIFSR